MRKNCVIHPKQPRLPKVEEALTKTQTKRVYDELGHLIQETLATNLTLASSYDAYGRRTSLTLPDGSKIDFTYKGLFLTSLSYKGYTHTYAKRDLDGHLLEALLPKDLGTLSIARDRLGRYKTIESPTFSATYTTYDSVGNLIEYSFKDSIGSQTKSFSYDDLNQLISEDGHWYRFDSLNNRLQKDRLIYSVNDLCQMVSDGESAYCYDPNGNSLSDQTWNYSYDSLDRLISMSKESCTIEYTYDAFHRRLSKTILLDNHPPQTLYYLWDGENEIGALDEEGHLIELRILGEGLGAEIGAAVLFFLDNTFYVPIHDHRGCIVTLINTETTLAEESYRYTAFGEEERTDKLSPWRFTSKRTDKETSLVYFGRRYYMPKIGRWITCDPIGFKDGPNLYAYTHNNPLILLDLYGHKGFEPKGSVFPKFNVWDTIGITYISRAVARYFFSSDYSAYEDSMENKSHTFDAQSLTRQMLNTFSNGATVIAVNGANNSLETASEHFELLAERTGYNFTCCYNATHGLYKDAGEVVMNRIGMATTPCFVLGGALDNHFEKNPHAPVLLIGTSQGSEIVAQTVSHYDPEKRDLIHVCLMAPVMFLDERVCSSVQHYVVPIHRDPTQLFDTQGRIRCRDTVHVLDCHPDAPFLDHSISSPTYRDPAIDIFRRFEGIAQGLK